MNHLHNYRRDTMFNGDVVCYQREDGYRFSIDSVLLAGFWQSRNMAEVLDLGCGCGILGLILLYKSSEKVRRVVGVELQESLAAIARRNAKENGLDQKLQIIHEDVGTIADCFPAESFSHVICNPPFYSIGTGRTSRQKEAHIARHQVAADLDDFVGGASYVLKNKGSLTIVYPAERTAGLFASLARKNMQPKRIRYVYSYPEAEEAELILVECLKNGGEGLKVLRPIFVYTQKNGEYTTEVAEYYAQRSTK